MLRIFIAYSKAATVLAVLMLCISSCKKPVGEGGNSSITGMIYYNYYDHNEKLIAREPAVEEDVFIIYGEDDFYGDDVEANNEGYYRFNFLTKGSYTIFAYEDCDACYSGDGIVEVSVEISDRKTIAEAPDLELVKYLDVDDGTSTITGKVFLEDYNKNGELVEGYYLGNERVYLVYDKDSTYYDDTRTNPDGTYVFKELIPGLYRVYAYSKCDKENNSSTYSKCVMTVGVSGKVNSQGEIIQLPDIVIYD